MTVPRDLARLQDACVCVCMGSLRRKGSEARGAPFVFYLRFCTCAPIHGAESPSVITLAAMSVDLLFLFLPSCVNVCMRVLYPRLQKHVKLLTPACVCVSMHLCVKCVNRAHCQQCTTVEVAMAVFALASSLS